MGRRRSVPKPDTDAISSSQKRRKTLSSEKSLGSAEVCSADFAIAWKALPSNRTGGGLSGFTVSVSQRIRRKNKQEMWKSVAIHCADEPDGSLVVQVMAGDPDWEAPVQIAELRSRPDDLSCFTPLGCNLDHVRLGERH